MNDAKRAKAWLKVRPIYSIGSAGNPHPDDLASLKFLLGVVRANERDRLARDAAWLTEALADLKLDRASK